MIRFPGAPSAPGSTCWSPFPVTCSLAEQPVTAAVANVAADGWNFGPDRGRRPAGGLDRRHPVIELWGERRRLGSSAGNPSRTRLITCAWTARRPSVSSAGGRRGPSPRGLRQTVDWYQGRMPGGEDMREFTRESDTIDYAQRAGPRPMSRRSRSWMTSASPPMPSPPGRSARLERHGAPLRDVILDLAARYADLKHGAAAVHRRANPRCRCRARSPVRPTCGPWSIPRSTCG